MSGQDRQNSNEHNEGAVGCMSIGWATLGLAPKTVLSSEARFMRYELTDREWAAIKPMLPNKPRGVPRVNDRRVLNGSSGSCDPEHQDSNHSCYIDHSADDDVLIFTLISHRRPLS